MEPAKWKLGETVWVGSAGYYRRAKACEFCSKTGRVPLMTGGHYLNCPFCTGGEYHENEHTPVIREAKVIEVHVSETSNGTPSPHRSVTYKVRCYGGGPDETKTLHEEAIDGSEADAMIRAATAVKRCESDDRASAAAAREQKLAELKVPHYTGRRLEG